MMKIVLLLYALCTPTCCLAFLSNILSSYRTILEEINPSFNETSLISTHDIMQLISVLDGNPKYNSLALSQVSELITGTDQNTDQKFSWDFFETVVTKIYGDQISEDPFEPQVFFIYVISPINQYFSSRHPSSIHIGNPLGTH